MSAFYDNNITDVGRLLLADIQSGAKFVPTKIVIGSGYMPQGKTTRTMTDVAEIVKELSLNKVQKTSDGSVIFGAAFSNEDILEPFYYRELGLYAKGVYYNAEGEPSNETEEVLYSYGNAGDNAELIPAYSEGSITERQLDLIVYIGNDTEVVLNIEAGIYVTMPVFTEQIEKINKEIITIKADFDGINDKIGITTDDEGTVSTGTVFGKLNSILLYLTVTLVEKLSKITEDISENKTSIGNAEDLSTSPTIFGKLAEIKEIITSNFADIISKIAGIDSKIGTTTDTGGTSSAGGIFAKLNNVISYLTGYITQKIDTIDSNVTQIKPSTYNAEMNAHQAATNTAINNTPSATGILSQKMSYAINQLSNYNIDDAISFINNLKIDKQMYVNTRETCLFCADENYLYLIPNGSEEGVICRIKQDTFEVDYKKINVLLNYVDNNTILVDKNYIYLVDNTPILYKINKSTFTVSGSLNLSSISNLGVPKGFMGQTNSYLVLRGAGSSSYQPYRINKNTLVAESLSDLTDSDAQLDLDDVFFDETYMYYFRTISNVCTIYKVNISQKTKSTIYTFNAPRGASMRSLSIDSSNLYFQFDNLLYTVSKTGSLIDTFYIGNLKEAYIQNANIVSYGKNPLTIGYRKSFWSVNYVNYEEKIVKTAAWQYPYITSSNYHLYLAYPDEFIFGKTNFAYVLSTHNGINKIMKFILD